MSNAETHLNEILDKIQTRIETISRTLISNQNDIESMHEYYWENYAEMDEYGYEHFDNQQALLTAVNAGSQQLELKHRYKKMLSSPYFGRVDFRYEDEDEAETFYIGIGNFAEREGYPPLIYDWRAPISSLFYDYDCGKASYTAPGGEINGEITEKWQYKIRNGKMIYALKSDIKIDDDVLRQELGSSGETKLKNIIHTIQKEQNKIIRNTNDRILVIQGVAGSGKTSVALHRIAYLLYHERNFLKSSNVLILSPNSVFSDYISHILPELGEENIRETSFDIFAYHELKEWIYDCENKYDYLEQLMQESIVSETYKQKQSQEFVKELYGFTLKLEYELVNFRDVHIRKWTFEASRLQNIFYERFMDTPIISRMKAIEEYVTDEYETLTGQTLSEEDAQELHEQFERMLVTTDLYNIYNMFLKQLNLPALPNTEREARYIPYEDVYPMLYLKYLLYSRSTHKNIKHLIIDEMQDYSFIQYQIISMLFNCKMTILGDKAQTIDDEISDVTKFLPRLLGRDIHCLEMNRSYRNTMEIAAYAGSVGKYSDIDMFERHGEAVNIFDTKDINTAYEKLLDTLLKDTQSDTSAVIAFSHAEALACYNYLKEKLSSAGFDIQNKLHFIDENSRHFNTGISITTFYLAKGLEFEHVHFLDDIHKNSSFYDQARYISATRALHRLSVYKW